MKRRPGWRPKSSAAVFAAILAVIVAAPLLQSVLPRKYFFDSGFIQLLAQGAYPFPTSQSFRNTGAIYRLLGLANNPFLASVAGIGGLVTLLLVPRIRQAKVEGPGALIVVLLVVLSGAAYLSQYSKDVFVLPVSFVAAIAPATKRGEIALILAIAVYAAEFRSYWALIGVTYLLLLVVMTRARRPLILAASLMAFLLALSILFAAVLHQPLDHYRTAVTIGRETATDSNTLITPFLDKTDPASETANAVLILTSLLVPVPLVALGTPFYLGIAALLVAFWGWTWRRARIILTAHTVRDRFAVRAASLLFAVVTVQSVFEPDYGSYLKHLSPVLPLAFLLFRAVPTGNTGQVSTHAP